MNIWHILNIARTQDIRAIKRAYAAQAKQCHPDDTPEQFLQLRAAYEQALEYAQDNRATSMGVSRFSPLPEKEIQRQFFQPNTPSVIAFDEKITTESDEPVTLPEKVKRPDFNSIFRQAEQNRLELMLEQGVLRTLLAILADNKQRNSKQAWHYFVFSAEFLQAQLNDDFLQVLVYCLTHKSGIPVTHLPRNMYIYLLLAFDAVTDKNNADISHITPLIEVMQQHPHYTYIEKDIRRKEFDFIRRGFTLYHDVLKLHARSRLQPMASVWYCLLNRLESNYNTRGRNETYSLLAFFVRCNPDLPDYVYKTMYKVFDLAGYHQSSRKQALKPLYEALHEYRSELVLDIAQEQHLAASMRLLFSAFRRIWRQYRNADATFYFEIAMLPEAEQLFTSELFLVIQFETRVLNYFNKFFGTRNHYIALGLSTALYRVYQQHTDKKGVTTLLQSINQYLDRALAERTVDTENKTDENNHTEAEEKQAVDSFTDKQTNPLSLEEDSEVETAFEYEYEEEGDQQRPLPEDGILRTLLDILNNEKIRNNKELWRDFILSEPFLSQYHGSEFLTEIVYWLKRQTALPIRQLPRNMYLFLNIAFCPLPHSFTLAGYSDGLESQPDLALLQRLMRQHVEYHLFANDLKQPDLEELHKAFYIYNSAQTLYIEQGFTPLGIWERLFGSVCGSEDCLCNAYLFRILPTFVRLHPEMPVGIYKIMHKKYKLERYHTSFRKQILKDFYDSLAIYRRIYISDAEKKHLEMLNKQLKKQFRKAFTVIYKNHSTTNKANLSQEENPDDVGFLFRGEMFRAIQFDDEIISDLKRVFSRKEFYISQGLWFAVYYAYSPYDSLGDVFDLLQILQKRREI